MKKIFVVLAALWSSLPTDVSSQQVDYGLHPLISKRTASWCTRCGGYGWDLFEGIVEDLEDREDIIPLAVHYSGDLENESSDVFAQYIGGSSQPVFFVNDVNQGVLSANANEKRIEIVNTAIGLTSETAPVGFGEAGAVIRDNQIEVMGMIASDTENRVFKVATYLILNDYVSFQAAKGSNAMHKKIIWESFTDDPMGEDVTLSVNPVMTTYSIDLEPLNLNNENQDMQVLMVVWEMDGNRPVYVNGRLLDLSVPVATQQQVLSDIRVFDDGQSIIIDQGTTAKRSYAIYTLDGQLLSNGDLTDGRNYIAAPWTSGTYVVQITEQDLISTEKIAIIR